MQYYSSAAALHNRYVSASFFRSTIAGVNRAYGRNDMNKFLGPFCFVLFVTANGCTTPATSGESANQSAPSPQRMASASLRIFDGNQCSGSGGNCLPDVVVSPTIYVQHNLALAALDEAVVSGSTSTFVDSDQGRYLLPALALHPRQMELLRSGMPVIRLDRAGGRRFYVASRLGRDELLRRIQATRRGQPVPGVEVCIPVRVR